MLSAPSYAISGPQFGRVMIVPSGGLSATAVAHAVPEHPEIAKVTVDGSRVAQRVDVTYAITHANGRIVNGAIAWTANGERAAPSPLPTTHSAPNSAGIQSGAYAASLLTASDLSSIFGHSFPAPTANGGRLEYDNGIDVSNATAAAAGYEINYSVYIGATPTATASFWKKQGLGAANISGSWKDAFWLSTVATLYVYATDTRTLLIQIQQPNATTAPTTTQLEAWQQKAESVATKLVHTLKTN